MPRVELRGVTKRFGEIVAVDHIDLEIEDGEYLGIIGPSGCGKTTLMRCIAGIIEPDEGDIYVDGERVNGVPPEERGVGYVFQNICLFPHMDSWDNITYGPVVKGLRKDDVRRIAIEILDVMKLSVRAEAFPDELSRGTQQKVSLARALVSGVDLVLLDEPLSALDARVRTQLRSELRRMIKDLGITAIHVTHDQEEAAAVSDRIVVMRAGSIEQVGTPLELYTHPNSLFTAKFIGGECNFLEGTVKSKGEDGVTIDLGDGVSLEASNPSFQPGERVVLAVKPELIHLRRRDRGFPGRIISTSFLGPIIHYEVEIPGGRRVVVKTSRRRGRDLKRGDEIGIYINPDDILVYPYPAEGLEKALEIE